MFYNGMMYINKKINKMTRRCSNRETDEHNFVYNIITLKPIFS